MHDTAATGKGRGSVLINLFRFPTLRRKIGETNKRRSLTAVKEIKFIDSTLEKTVRHELIPAYIFRSACTVQYSRTAAQSACNYFVASASDRRSNAMLTSTGGDDGACFLQVSLQKTSTFSLAGHGKSFVDT